jgi:hypothetical protein
MEAATTLPFAQVRIIGDRLHVDGLAIADECAVRLAREADNPAGFVGDAIEIGARVLDREQTAANAEFVKAEFERAARDLDKEFAERARNASDRLDAKFDEVFGGETGHVTKLLSRHFGDESSVAVQNRVKALLAEAQVQIREDLRKQFSSDDAASNPIAGFQQATLGMMKQHSQHQVEQLRAMAEQMQAMELRIAELKAEKEKLTEIAAVEEKGTAKGRSYEEAVFDAVAAIARGRGDDCDSVGDVRGEGGKKGDVVVAVDAGSGPARGRIVLEAKDRQLSKNAALAELDGCLETRNADYAVLVVPSEAELPARTFANHEFNANKVFCVYDPEDGSTLSLEVAYTLARARVLMARDDAAGLDAAGLRTEVERAVQALEDVRRIKSQLTNATTGIENARQIVEAMAGTVRSHLAQANALIDAAEPEAA